jgi:hypothetical protein
MVCFTIALSVEERVSNVVKSRGVRFGKTLGFWLQLDLLVGRRIFNCLQKSRSSISSNFNLFPVGLSNLYKKNLLISVTPSKDCCQQKICPCFCGQSKSQPFYARANRLPSTQNSTTFIFANSFSSKWSLKRIQYHEMQLLDIFIQDSSQKHTHTTTSFQQ